jgi:hypothetical protein
MNPKVADVAKTMLDVLNDEATPPPVQQWLSSLIERLQDSDSLDERFVKGTPIPTSIGAQADEYSVVRAERLRIEKEAAEVKKRETELYNCIMSTLDESPDTGAMGEFYAVQRVEKDQAQIDNTEGDGTGWPKFWAYLQATGNFDLMQKRLNDKAIRDRVEAGETVPGVKVEKVPTLSFTKVPNK